ncbi:hypothetical protein D3C79_949800 [compost metagenome]
MSEVDEHVPPYSELPPLQYLALQGEFPAHAFVVIIHRHIDKTLILYVNVSALCHHFAAKSCSSALLYQVTQVDEQAQKHIDSGKDDCFPIRRLFLGG